jgi:methionyl-tRNA synthetase
LLQTWLGVFGNALGQDGFSLNRAAAALDGLVTDTLRFSELESKTADLPDWADETRTAIALELAAAKLLAHCAAPVMPRFAAKLAAALGLDEPTQWPELVTLVPPGTKVKLAGQVFFQDPSAESAAGDLLPWLTGVVEESLAGEGGEPDRQSSLVALGLNSMQAIALQYQILQRTGADIAIDDLLGDRTLAELAELLAKQQPPADEADEVVV